MKTKIAGASFKRKALLSSSTTSLDEVISFDVEALLDVLLDVEVLSDVLLVELSLLELSLFSVVVVKVPPSATRFEWPLAVATVQASLKAESQFDSL